MGPDRPIFNPFSTQVGVADRAEGVNQKAGKAPGTRPKCPKWLADVRRAFKSHRMGRPGWFVTEHRDRLRLTSHELPPRPGEPSVATGKTVTRALTLNTPPGPSTIGKAIAELTQIFDEVMEGSWRWPDDPLRSPQPNLNEPLKPDTIATLTRVLRGQLVGEQLKESTWESTWRPYLKKLAEIAIEQNWATDEELLKKFLGGWDPGTRARQMAHDRARRIWKEAQRPWPESIAALRGNGKAAADPHGVSAFSDQQIEDLREAIKASRLTNADLVAWDLLICFGLRPKELQGLELRQEGSDLFAVVSRIKRSSKGSVGARTVPAVPPAGWPADCDQLFERWQKHPLPEGLRTMNSPGELLSRQLRRLHMPRDLTAYGMRHAFALRLGIELGLDVRSAAELMGHSAQTHLSEYGKKLNLPALHNRVASLVHKRSAQ
jgi:integrase